MRDALLESKPAFVGEWRSLAAHLTGGQEVAGSNPASPTSPPQHLASAFIPPAIAHIIGPLRIANRAVVRRSDCNTLTRGEPEEMSGDDGWTTRRYSSA